SLFKEKCYPTVKQLTKFKPRGCLPRPFSTLKFTSKSKNKLMNLQKELENLLQKDQLKKENILTSQRTQELFQYFEKNHNQEAQQFKQKLEKSVENQKQVNNLMNEAIKK